MFQTKAARSLKNLFAKYHEPPQLSDKQSKKLLDGLKTSFRDQLDREHGPGPSSHEPSTNSRREDAYQDQLRRSAGLQHLKTLLSNPLFSVPSSAGPVPLQSNKSAQSAQSAQSTAPRDPMDDFDRAVSRGLMNSNVAAGILMTKQKQLRTDLDGLSVLAGGDVARRVIQWIRSSGSLSDFKFVDSRPLIDALMPFIVAEGLDEVVWEWISHLLGSIDHNPTVIQRQRASVLLRELIRFKSLPQDKDLDGAMMTLVQARETFKSNPFLPRLLRTPWRDLSWLTTVESYTRKTPRLSVFNAHMATAEYFKSTVEVEKAHLLLYHPERSDATPALRLFHNHETFECLNHRTRPSTLHSPRRWLLALGDDTMNFLARSGRSREAKEVAKILEAEMKHHKIMPT